MNLKDKGLFRGFYEDPLGKNLIYIEGKPVRGKWMLGDLKIVVYGEGDERCFIRAFHRNSKRWKVIPQTVSRFTGQWAKKRKIFEHDICRFSGDDGQGEDFLVRWNDALCRFEVAWTENDATDDLDDFFAERAKVIGTVFDRKEE